MVRLLIGALVLAVALVSFNLATRPTRGPVVELNPPSQDRIGSLRPADSVLREMLDATQYRVTQLDATEQAFNNPYHDLKDDGIYVDIVSGEPLFSSLDKYDSRTGWPSFTKPLVEENIYTKADRFLTIERTEVRSVGADSHLGHVFPDGPEPTGLRYCMNSAALRFIPADSLAAAGYEQFVGLFAEQQR